MVVNTFKYSRTAFRVMVMVPVVNEWGGRSNQIPRCRLRACTKDISTIWAIRSVRSIATCRVNSGVITSTL